MNAEMVSVPLDDLKRTINVLRYAAHPHPSPHADYWENFLAKPAVQHLGEMVKQWSDDGLLWSDGEEHEMASARAEGYMTRTLYLHPAERPAPTCPHRFMYFGSQPLRRCADCNVVEGNEPKLAPVAVVMPERMNEHDAAQKLLGRFGVYGVVPADVATDIYNSALAEEAKLNEVKGE